MLQFHFRRQSCCNFFFVLYVLHFCFCFSDILQFHFWFQTCSDLIFVFSDVLQFNFWFQIYYNFILCFTRVLILFLASDQSQFHFWFQTCCNFIFVFGCKKVKLVTLAEGDPKAPFSIAITPRYKRGRYSNPWIAPRYP